MTEEDLRKSVAYFEAALGADPDCALAYAGLADTYSLLACLGILPAKEAHARASEFTAAALRIDEQTGGSIYGARRALRSCMSGIGQAPKRPVGKRSS